ncbi:rhodanese-like domain-containing protein [Actinomycetota bacterium]
MTRKLFLLTTILFLLISLVALPISSGCKATTTTSEKVSDESGEVQEENEDNKVAEIKPISPEEVYDIIKNDEDYLIVDVRTIEEYNSGHLEGALLLPVQELEDRLNELPMDKPIIVYCRSGNRSRTAAEILVNNGFKQIYDMGGISDWTVKGYPVVEE